MPFGVLSVSGLSGYFDRPGARFHGGRSASANGKIAAIANTNTRAGSPPALAIQAPPGRRIDAQSVLRAGNHAIHRHDGAEWRPLVRAYPKQSR